MPINAKKWNFTLIWCWLTYFLRSPKWCMLVMKHSWAQILQKSKLSLVLEIDRKWAILSQNYWLLRSIKTTKIEVQMLYVQINMNIISIGLRKYICNIIPIPLSIIERCPYLLCACHVLFTCGKSFPIEMLINRDYRPF